MRCKICGVLLAASGMAIKKHMMDKHGEVVPGDAFRPRADDIAGYYADLRKSLSKPEAGSRVRNKPNRRRK